MSKINELIQTLCPDGVEYKKLGEVGCVRMCKRIMKDQTSSTGDLPFYKIGTFGGTANAYITQELFDEYSSKYNYPKKGNILISAAGTIGRTVVFDGKPSYFQDSNIVWLEHDGTQVTDEYLKYIYSTSPWYVADGGTISRLYNDNILNAVIPVPPLPVQDEIVRILDEYTELEAELEAKLSEEIELKQKQYEFYMDKLLTFGDDVERKKLGEVCILSAGGDAPKTHMSKIKSDEYKYPIYSNGIGDNALYGYTDEYKISSPCVTVAARGTIGWAALRMEPFYPIVRLICVLPNDYDELNVSFLKYFIDIMEFPVPEGGIPQLTVPMLKNREIPIPSLTEQERIVKILDKYDTYTRDMISTLNIELESRKKQYAYYRDQLLTFKRKE